LQHNIKMKQSILMQQHHILKQSILMQQKISTTPNVLSFNSPNNNKRRKLSSDDLAKTSLFLSWRNNGASIVVVYGFVMFIDVASMKNYNEEETGVITCSHRFLWRSQTTLFHPTTPKALNFLATNKKQI
jgi:hypothetical protein